MSNAPRRIFLGWDRPLLPQAVEWLARDWAGGTALDLSSLLVIVPTRQSGRRLREALATYAAARGAAVFPPRVVTPEGLLAEARSPAAPSRVVSLLAWVEVLRTVDLDDFRDVFPVDPPARNFSWAVGLADRLIRVQATLAEHALQIRDVADRVGAGFVEYARWEQLGALEQAYESQLQRVGYETNGVRLTQLDWSRGFNRGETRLKPHSQIQPPPSEEAATRIVLLATPDPMPLIVEALGASDCAVDVVIFAPAEKASLFDAWGRPLTEAWTNRIIDWPEFERTVHLCADPDDEAARIVAVAAEYRAASRGGGEVLELGVADPEVASMLETEAAAVRLPVFDPQGRRHAAGALFTLLRALATRSKNPDFGELEALARCPAFLDFATARLGPSFSAARFLASLDRLKSEHIPATLAEALGQAKRRREGVVPARSRATDDPAAEKNKPARPEVGPHLLELQKGLALVQEIAERMHDGTFPENIASVLADLFGSRTLNPTTATDAELQEAAQSWTDTVRELAALTRSFPNVAAGEWYELAMRVFAGARFAAEKPAGALEVQGWLELAFADAPHVVVAGLNDGLVPEAIAEDAFLPDPLRRKLGLRHNGTRFARDAYLLEALVHSRRRAGRVDFLLAKTSTVGDPLRPSRLLLRCADEGLPARVQFLFQTPDRRESHLTWQRAWKLSPRQVAPPTQVAVTALRRWLACRFRFYLKYALKMEAVDVEKSEMDAFDFGRLCHTALEAMGRDASMRDCVDPARLREFLLGKLAVATAEKFGRDLSLPIVIQLESARQRLGKFAEIQARERAEGWVIEQVERPITVRLGGVTVRGQVDRIDRNERTGAVRVLDYKTSDAGVIPRVAHTRAWREGEALPDWAAVEIEGRRKAWADLQLPLYRAALAPEFGGEISLGYITLPKAVGETTVALWDDYTPDLHASAMACAAGVCAAIERGEFWPPSEDVRADNDEFAALFHEGAAASIAWDDRKAEGGRREAEREP